MGAHGGSAVRQDRLYFEVMMEHKTETMHDVQSPMSNIAQDHLTVYSKDVIPGKSTEFQNVDSLQVCRDGLPNSFHQKPGFFTWVVVQIVVQKKGKLAGKTGKGEML